MPINRNALIRYKTIDNCLKNNYRKWTLEDLIDACSDALYEYEGIDKGISKRTIQMDIQLMRSEKLGYNAPIVVYDKKYYKYEDDDYSITNTPLNEQDLRKMSEAVEVLRQFSGFSYFNEMGEIVNRLEDHVTSAKQQTKPVIDFEKIENLKGLQYLDQIYKAIVDKISLNMHYKSFSAKTSANFIFYPYLLKEYRNRWFVFGERKGLKGIYNLALDRILDLEISSYEKYKESENFDASSFFNDIVGVTKQLGNQPEIIRFWVNSENAPYILTKPFHKTQTLIEELEDKSIIFEIKVIINRELEREFLGFADSIKIISPKKLASFFRRKFEKAAKLYP